MFRVAIADHHDDTRSLLRLWLEREYEISDYSNADQLIADLLKKHFHLLLVDLKLRTADGSELLKTIRTLPGRPRPVTIALTASAFNSDRERAIALGFDDLLTKPIDKVKLQGTIQKYLR
jgi:two-component system, cell cycle response regulator DivK